MSLEGKIPEGWAEIQFTHIVDNTQLGTVERGHAKEDSENIPLVKMGNLEWGNFNLSSLEIVSRHKLKDIEGLLLLEGDLLFNTRNTMELVGKSSVWLSRYGEAVFDNNINRIRFHLSVYPYFMNYLLNYGSVRKSISALASGSTSVAAIYWSSLAKLRLHLPPLPEQRKIAAILSTWDDSLATLGQLLAAKRQQKRGLAEALLTGKTRLKGFEGEWEEREINELFREVTRFIDWDDSKSYVQAIVRRWSQGITTREELEGEKIKVKKLQEVKLNDFLISNIQAAYGAMAKVSKSEEGLYVSNLYTILESKPDLGDINYLDQFSRLSKMEQLVIASSNGFKAERIRLNFDQKVFLKQKILFPPTVYEQQAIASVLSALDGEIATLERLRSAVAQQKRGLMDELLTGRVRVAVEG